MVVIIVVDSVRGTGNVSVYLHRYTSHYLCLDDNGKECHIELQHETLHNIIDVLRFDHHDSPGIYYELCDALKSKVGTMRLIDVELTFEDIKAEFDDIYEVYQQIYDHVREVVRELKNINLSPSIEAKLVYEKIRRTSDIYTVVEHFIRQTEKDFNITAIKINFANDIFAAKFIDAYNALDLSTSEWLAMKTAGWLITVQYLDTEEKIIDDLKSLNLWNEGIIINQIKYA